MKNNLLIVTDLGLLKAYKVGLTPKHTPRLQPLEDVVLEEAHHRVIEMVTDVAGRHVAPTQKSWGTPIADAQRTRPRSGAARAIWFAPNGAMSLGPGLSGAIPREHGSKTSSTPTGLWQMATRLRTQPRWG